MQTGRQLNGIDANDYGLVPEPEFLPQPYFGSNKFQTFDTSQNDGDPSSAQILFTGSTLGSRSAPALPCNNEIGAYTKIAEDRWNPAPNQRTPEDIIGSQFSNHSNSPTMPAISDANAVSLARRTHRFCCPHPSCADRSFGRRGDRDRHVRKHSVTERTYACPKPACGKLFYRKDKLLDHTRHGHRPKKTACTCAASRHWVVLLTFGYPKRKMVSIRALGNVC